MKPPPYDTFTKPAAELVQIMGWAHGTEFKKELMLACYRRSRGGKVNMTTVCAVLDDVTRAYDEAAKVPPAVQG